MINRLWDNGCKTILGAQHISHPVRGADAIDIRFAHDYKTQRGCKNWLGPLLLTRSTSDSAMNKLLHHTLTVECDFILNHWGRVTHIRVGNLTIIGPDNGLSPGRRQAIIWTNAWILLIVPWGTNVSEILLGIQTFSFKKMHLKMSSAK